MNQSKPDHSSSTRIPPLRMFKGTQYNPNRSKPWKGRIRFNGKEYRSRYFDTEQEAHEWYLAKSEELYGFNRFEAEQKAGL